MRRNTALTAALIGWMNDEKIATPDAIFENAISLQAKPACKDIPSGYSKRVCVSTFSESSEPTMLFCQTTPDEHAPTPPPSR